MVPHDATVWPGTARGPASITPRIGHGVISTCHFQTHLHAERPRARFLSDGVKKVQPVGGTA